MGGDGSCSFRRAVATFGMQAYGAQSAACDREMEHARACACEERHVPHACASAPMEPCTAPSPCKMLRFNMNKLVSQPSLYSASSHGHTAAKPISLATVC
jgi:hypothetical protein